MDVSLLEAQGCERTLKVAVTADELKPEIEKAYQEYRKKVRLEGFRKGKAPLHLIKKLYGDAIEAEALDNAIKALYPQALVKSELQPVSEGNIEDLQYQPGEDLSFTVKVEVAPAIELMDLAGIKARKELRTIRDENVEAFLEQVRFQHATREEVTIPAEHGHFIQADVQQLDPNTRLPIIGNKWDDRYFEIGKEVLGPEVDAQLVGVKTGEQIQVVRKYPADWHEPSLAGKDEHFQLTIKKVDRIILPALDDELAKDIGNGLQTLDQLKDHIRQDMEAQISREGEEQLRRDLMTEALRRHDFPVPGKMIESVIKGQIEQAKSRSEEPVDEGQMRIHLKPFAERTIKWYWLRDALVKAHAFTVDEADIQARVLELGKQNNMDEATAKKVFGGRYSRERLEEDLLESKVFDYLKSIAVVEEVWV